MSATFIQSVQYFIIIPINVFIFNFHDKVSRNNERITVIHNFFIRLFYTLAFFLNK